MELEGDEWCLPTRNAVATGQDEQIITLTRPASYNRLDVRARGGRGLRLLMKLVMLCDKFGQTFCRTRLEIRGAYHINALHVEYTEEGHICNY